MRKLWRDISSVRTEQVAGDSDRTSMQAMLARDGAGISASGAAPQLEVI
jgi:hypothetical protein